MRTFASIVHVRRGELVSFIKSKGFLFGKFTYLCVFVLYMCVCAHLGMSLCLCITPQRSEEDIGSFGTVVTVDDCELLSGFWEQNLGPLQEQ